MLRRTFLEAALSAAAGPAIPNYKIVTRYESWTVPGMPGPLPGEVTAVHSERCLDNATEKVDAATLREMMGQGMTSLTGKKDVRDAWAQFFVPADVVGIKVNCSGAPGIMSTPEVVAEIVRNLNAVGVGPERVWIYERFGEQMDTVGYQRYLPAGVHIEAAERSRGLGNRYDPNTYVEVNFFGEEDTRSNLIRNVAERFTKIINVPNMKDHGASGVTGCLKNIAYGDFSNVARSHNGARTHTYSFIGTLASVEPVRSRTVLQVMDGLRGVWHGGPFSPSRRFRFYPKQMMFATDPVAIDRLLIDIIDQRRKAEGAVSVWERSEKYLQHDPRRGPSNDPNVNRFIREPGHIEYAAKQFKLGVYDLEKIRVKRIEL